MNKNKIFLLAAVTALTGGALVGVAAFAKTNGFSFAKADTGYEPIMRTYDINANNAEVILKEPWGIDDEYCYEFSISTPTQTDPTQSITTTSGYAETRGVCLESKGSSESEDIVTFTSTGAGIGVYQLHISFAFFDGAIFDDDNSYVKFHSYERGTHDTSKVYFIQDGDEYSCFKSMTDYNAGSYIAIKSIHLEYLC